MFFFLFFERLLWNWKNHFETIASAQTKLSGAVENRSPVLHQPFLQGSIQCRLHQLEILANDFRKIPPPFELEGMLYYSTLVKLELIGQILSFKCNNVKEIKTEYHSSHRQGKKKKSSFVHQCLSFMGPCAVFWDVPQLYEGRRMLLPLHYQSRVPLQVHRQKMLFGEIQ